MSHEATAWAVSVRGISAGEFRVLMTLADCHNPKNGCYPSQEYLRDATEMSNGALNENLSKLETKGLIKREKQGRKGEGGRAPTRYILGVESGLTPDIGDNLNSTTPEITPGKLRPTGDNVNSGPLEETGGVNSTFAGGKLRPTGDEPVRTGKKKEKDLLSGFAEFWSIYPHRGGAKRKRGVAEAKFAAAVRRGIPEQVMIDAARRYAGDRQVIDGYARDPATWLNQKGWEDDIEAATRSLPVSRQEYIAKYGTSAGWSAT